MEPLRLPSDEEIGGAYDQGKEAVIELRQLIELDEFPPSEALDSFKQLDAQRHT